MKKNDSLSEENVKGHKTLYFYVRKFHISVDCATKVVILPESLKFIKEDNGDLVHEEAVQNEYNNSALLDGGSGVVIKEEHLNMPQKGDYWKAHIRITKHIILLLYLRCYCIERYSKLCIKSTLRPFLLLIFVYAVTTFGMSLWAIRERHYGW